ncbi:SRPBCC family protein [Virgisporangium ochraceum]|nr:SRPBCC family protein [Virgisporangium ochraceum]
MDISETYDFTAPPEVVFDSLTDPDRAHRWLPSGVRRDVDDNVNAG